MAMQSEQHIMDRARALLNRGNSVAAAELYRELVVRNPDDIHAVHLLGVAEATAGNMARAKPLLDRALQSRPVNSDFVKNSEAALYGERGTRRIPFGIVLTGANGDDAWFRIAIGKRWGISGVTSGSVISGMVKLSADDGRYSWSDWEFLCGATTHGSSPPVLSHQRGFPLDPLAPTAIDQARLSRDSDENVALDLHVPAGLNADKPVSLTGEFDGYVTPVIPAINSLPLGSSSATLNFIAG
uniref:tetratricopeptide repeat protein n=1 Tax=Bradyrhizobium sp. (strain ORS 278) TaxID=114615 RepID=UPI0012FEE427|nr:tetratricopeptide repeat protein [Bradyrhizobium sp. ORS 278]